MSNEVRKGDEVDGIVATDVVEFREGDGPIEEGDRLSSRELCGLLL